MIAYLIFDEDADVKRVYLDRAEADGFVDAYRATGGGLEVEEIMIGAPDVEYDGPVWVGTWTTRRKLLGEMQLTIVTDGFTMVVPSAVPAKGSSIQEGYSIQEVFALKPGPGWRDLAAPEYEEPPVWIDQFRFHQEWHTGDDPILTCTQSDNRLEVRGTSKDAVEQLLRTEAHRAKAAR